MNKLLVFRLAGFILLLEAAAMCLPLAVSLVYQQYDYLAFLMSIGITGSVGAILWLLTRKSEKHNIYAREGFMVVGLSWVLISAFGALPYYLSGAIPTYVDSLFECISGFSTTGATILREIETMPKGLLFWRSFTQWIGGMGVLILFMALLPTIGMRGQNLMKAESPGPSPGKLVPRLAGTAKRLYAIYTGMTAVMVVALLLAGQPFFDALCNAFATAGTGGFAITNTSIGQYQSPAVEYIIAIFMLLFSVNFTMYHLVLTKKWLSITSNTELKYFGAIVFAAVMLIWINIGSTVSYAEGFRHSLFQVASIMSSSGFSTTDYNTWPDFSRFILVALMFVGACGGSTGGGIKVSRIVILFKSLHREIKKIVHPRSVPIIRVDGKALEEQIIANVPLFFVAYIMVIALSTLLITWDNLGFTTSLTAVIACVGNTGPGLDLVGPMGNYAMFSPFSKIVLSVCMLIGRLEVFPILVLLVPTAWRRH